MFGRKSVPLHVHRLESPLFHMAKQGSGPNAPGRQREPAVRSVHARWAVAPRRGRKRQRLLNWCDRLVRQP